MALLAQTADRVDLLYQSGTAAGAQFPSDELARPFVSAGVIMNATVVYGAAVNAVVNRVRVEPPQIIAPLSIWATQSVWQIGVVGVVISWGPTFYAQQGSKRVTALFTDQNLSGFARQGYVYERATGKLISAGVSSPAGVFTAYVPTVAPVTVVMQPSLADARNAVALDNLVPV